MANEFPMGRIPASCKHLYGSLFAVPFELIRTPDPDDNEESSEYTFGNPRLLTEQGRTDLLDKRLSSELRESIKQKTLLNPLVCRWVPEGDNFVPQLVGGDRRYRALDFLIKKREIVTDPNSGRLNDKGEWEYEQIPADEAYAVLACQIFAVNNDLDALALSWAENKGRINLSEGHEVAEVIKLRKCGAGDDRILEILQRDEKWLAVTDNLIDNLDVATLGDLIEGRIDRGSAIELSHIEDVDVRSKVREAANESAKESYDRKIKRLQKELVAANTAKEIATGSIADHSYDNDDEGVAAAEERLENANKRVQRITKERDGTAPVATAKDVKNAAADLGVDDDNRPVRILASKKIKEGLEYLDAIIRNQGNCLNDGSYICHVEHIKLARKIIADNILRNDGDFAATLRNHGMGILTAAQADD